MSDELAPVAVASRPSAETHRAVLLLDAAPVLLELRITIEGVSLSAARSEYVAKLMRHLDGDGDERLSREEAARSPLWRETTPDVARLFLRSLGEERGLTAQDLALAVNRVVGESVVYRQVSYPNTTDRLVFEFLDEDHSGALDAAEMASVAVRFMRRDDDNDECVDFAEIQLPAEPTELGNDVPASPQTTTRPATFADILRDVRDTRLSRDLLQRYDVDDDGRLDAKDLGWSGQRLAAMDSGADGWAAKAPPSLAATAPDLDVVIDLPRPGALHGTLSIAALDPQQTPVAEANGFFRARFGDAIVSMSVRDQPPSAGAVADALQHLSKLDRDGNKGLDREELQSDVRMRRGLFERIDENGDGTLSADEVQTHVETRGEAEAMTCRVYVYELGRGFFQALDLNLDGRLSRRELNAIEATLQSMDRNHSGDVTIDEPPRHFHIEFTRGEYRLFGQTDYAARGRSIVHRRPPAGPPWFLRMDANSDGDLTWQEFLGPREDFVRCDFDRDGLIDPREALAAMGEADATP